MTAATLSTITVELFHPHLRRSLRTWSFDTGDARKIVIGRCPSSHIIVRDNVVSRYHAMLERVGEDWYFKAIGKNGCYIADKAIARLKLNRRFSIRLGKTGPFLRLEARVSKVARERDTFTTDSGKKIYISEAARKFMAAKGLTMTGERTYTQESAQTPARTPEKQSKNTIELPAGTPATHR